MKADSAEYASVLIAWAITWKRRLAVRTRLVKGWNWALRRRFGARVVYNAIQDCRWGGWCGGTIESPYQHLGATATMSTDYAPLAAIFDGRLVPIGDDDVLVDIGCGKGRVLNYWLRMGCGRRLVGIELDEGVAAGARNRLKSHRNVEIITGCAVENLPPDGTLFYMFNPFESFVVAKLKRRLDQLASRRGPTAPGIRLVYYYCRHIDAFGDDPAWTISELPISDHHRAVLLERAPGTACWSEVGIGAFHRSRTS